MRLQFTERNSSKPRRDVRLDGTAVCVPGALLGFQTVFVNPDFQPARKRHALRVNICPGVDGGNGGAQLLCAFFRGASVYAFSDQLSGSGVTAGTVFDFPASICAESGLCSAAVCGASSGHGVTSSV